jgi:hypothetical protein
MTASTVPGSIRISPSYFFLVMFTQASSHISVAASSLELHQLEQESFSWAKASCSCTMVLSMTFCVKTNHVRKYVISRDQIIGDTVMRFIR